MQILASGSTDLIDRALGPHLEQASHEVTRLVRPETPATAQGILWPPSRGELDQVRLEGFNAVVHLAGETLDQRWTEQAK